MRRPRSSAALRRDDRLDRTRRLSAWIAGGATAASVGLAGLLGAAIPGHAATGSQHPSGQTGTGATGRQGTGQPSQPTSGGSQAHPRRHHISAPASPPSASTAPPVVSSGGS
jgi:hypothetical protein